MRPDELYHHGVKGQKWGVHKNRVSYTSMTDKQKLKMDKKASKIVARNNRLQRTMAKRDIKFKDNKGYKVAAISRNVIGGGALTFLAPTPASKAFVASVAIASTANILSGKYNEGSKRRLNKGQQWLKDNGYEVSENKKLVNAYSFSEAKGLGARNVTQYQLKDRKR